MDIVKSKKELKAQYKERKITGGVYMIKNARNNKMLIKAEIDLQGSRNRFDFSQKAGSCTDMKLQSDWNKYGGEHFVFEVLEEIEIGETQTLKEFEADIDVLKEIWLEKLSDKDLY